MIRIVGRLAIAAFLALAAAAAPAAHAREPAVGVMFVGIAGLAWHDVTAEDTPTLYSLVGPNAVASLTVRTVRPRTCVVDGWLTLGAGRRATDLPDLDSDDLPDRYCRDVPVPIGLLGGSAAVPGWDQLVMAQEEQAYDTRLGLLGDRIASTGLCATAVGPGAALALAQSDGVATSYLPDPAEIDEDRIAACPVTVVDLGSIPPPGELGDEEAERAAADARRAAATTVDAALDRLLQQVPDNVAVLVAGIADSAPSQPPAEDEPTTMAPSALRVALAAGPQPDGLRLRAELAELSVNPMDRPGPAHRCRVDARRIHRSRRPVRGNSWAARGEPRVRIRARLRKRSTSWSVLIAPLRCSGPSPGRSSRSSALPRCSFSAARCCGCGAIPAVGSG